MKLLRLFIVILCTVSLTAVAQDYNLNDKLPVDKNVRIGKLPNGLTYYLRKNSVPKDRVELRLAVNAGSVLEDEDQRGLAHFTEHMSFNGTKHFAKNDLIGYLQSVGVKFGSHLNAYTSFDETVYRLLVPTNNDAVVDKAFLILEDWAHNVTFDPQQIEGERGVITEEWRIGRGANQRMQDKFFPVVFHQSQYAQRLPIGKIEVIQNFRPESILRFYHDWYRPDLMAVVVVGDIDLDKYEQYVKAHFAAIPNPQNERPRTVFPVPDHSGTLYSVTTDKEATQTQIMIYVKKTHNEETTLTDYRDFVKEQLYYFMLNQRFGDLARSAEPPFISAHSSFQGIARAKDAFYVSGRVRENGVEKGLKAMLEEVERVKQFGFTESELTRAKKSVMMKYERTYTDRDKAESDGYAGELVRNFLNKEPVPGVPFEYEFTKNQLPGITLQELNDFDNAFLSDSNRVIVVTGPDKEGYTLPSEEQLKAVVATVAAEKFEPYTDKTVAFTWPGAKPTPGSIVKEETDKALNITTLTLSNGVKVLLKPTDFKNNETYIYAYSKGGHNLCSDADFYSALYASALVNESGIANLSKNALIKALAGKDVTVTPFINSTSEGISGKTSPADLETFFQLTNLYFTQGRIDSTVFRTFVPRTKSSLATIQLNPQKYFEGQVSAVLSGNHPRGGGFPKPEDLDKINVKRSVEIFHERFANAGDFTFIVVGAFDMEKIKPLFTTYIASLPATTARETTRDLGVRPPKGTVVKEFFKGTDPKSSVNLSFTGAVKYSAEDDYLLKSLNDVLTIQMMETLREEKSGVYGVRADSRFSVYPYENYTEQISFQCAPENVDGLIAAALKIIDRVKKEGVDATVLNKVKETQKHDLEVNIKSNIHWINELAKSVIYGVKVESSDSDKSDIDKLSSKELQRVARKYFGANYARMVLYPEKK
jgi:zinc protease